MTSNDRPDDYRYHAQPLTPAIIEALVLELFPPGTIVERRELVQRVRREHETRGGRASRARDLPRSAKKALDRLQRRDLAQKRSHGHWQIGPVPSGPSVVPALAESPTHRVETAVASEESPPAPEADVMVGTGSGSVYLYYLPTYRVRAEERVRSSWPCKIGWTSDDPLSRVLSQAATALPESPHVALVFRTPKALVWERALHSVLEARGRRHVGAVGSEWFQTSPSEVDSIIRFIDPDALVELKGVD